MRPLYTANIAGREQPVCCAGCSIAATLIAEKGLTEFYRRRTEIDLNIDAQQWGEADATAYAAFDDAALKHDFVQSDGVVETAQLAVGGMSCAACGWLLEHYLGSLPGIVSVRSKVGEQRLVVCWRVGENRPSDVLAAIKALGYEPRPYLPSHEYVALKAENRQYLQRLGVSGLLMMQIGMFALAGYFGGASGIEQHYQQFLRWASGLLILPVVFWCARPFFVAAWRGIRLHQPVMDMPVSLAILLAFIASIYATVTNGPEVYFDSIAMFVFFLLLVRYIERNCRQRATQLVAQSDALLPATASCRGTDGQWHNIPSARLAAGDTVIIKRGARAPCDGEVVEGASAFDEASFTGESMPRNIGVGDAVLAGTLNVGNALLVRAKAVGPQTQMQALQRLVGAAAAEKSSIESYADKIAHYFIAIVLLAAGITAGYWAIHDSTLALPITISVLIVSCPCALALATPLALAAASAYTREHGVIVKNENFLQALESIDTIVFDKTGTLTSGVMRLAATSVVDSADEAACLAIASALEAHSDHPIASAFDCADKDNETPVLVSEFTAETGAGITGKVGGKRYFLGSSVFVRQRSATDSEEPLLQNVGSKAVFLADRDGLLARFCLQDSICDDAPQAIEALSNAGYRIQLVSGDNRAEVSRVADALEIEARMWEFTPQQKLAHVRALETAGHRVMMVGDGVNDAPVMAAASASLAVLSATDFSRARADACLLRAGVWPLVALLQYAVRARRTVRQNLLWALCYNGVAIPAAALGLVAPWAAAIGMSGSSLLVALNALRLRRGGSDQWRCSGANAHSRPPMFAADQGTAASP